MELLPYLTASYVSQLVLEMVLLVTGFGLFDVRPWAMRLAVVYAVGWCAVVGATYAAVSTNEPYPGMARDLLNSMWFPVVLLVLFNIPAIKDYYTQS